MGVRRAGRGDGTGVRGTRGLGGGRGGPGVRRAAGRGPGEPPGASADAGRADASSPGLRCGGCLSGGENSR